MPGVLKTIREPNGAGHWISGDYDNNQSGEEIVLAATAVVLPGGTLLGQIAEGALTATPGAAVSGTGAAPGNATFGAITVDANALNGGDDVQIRFTDPTHYEMLVNGEIEGNGTLGQAYNGALNFTLTAGATPHVEDDRIPIAIAEADANDQYKPLNPAATDGTQNFAAILYEGRPIAVGTQKAVGVVRGPIVANLNLLTWINAHTNDQKAAIIAQAKKVGVVIRP